MAMFVLRVGGTEEIVQIQELVTVLKPFQTKSGNNVINRTADLRARFKTGSPDLSRHGASGCHQLWVIKQ